MCASAGFGVLGSTRPVNNIAEVSRSMLTTDEFGALPLYVSLSNTDVDRLVQTSADILSAPAKTPSTRAESALYVALSGKIEVVRRFDCRARSSARCRWPLGAAQSDSGSSIRCRTGAHRALRFPSMRSRSRRKPRRLQHVAKRTVLHFERLRAAVLVIARRHDDDEIERRHDADRLAASTQRADQSNVRHRTPERPVHHR